MLCAIEDALRAEPGAPDDTALAKAVARLSDLYTTDRGALRAEQAQAAHLAAKRFYFLGSDAPKVAIALEECAARSEVFSTLARRDRIRATDFGAGVGATSVGFLLWIAAARRALGVATPLLVELRAIELGEPAARAYESSVRAAEEATGVSVQISIEARDFRSAKVPADTDLILCQTALNELLAGDMHSDETAELVARWARAAPLLVIEPALKSTTRALMALRDALVARGESAVVAPCLHQRPCPMRAREGDWCHEARTVQPTPRVAAIDRIVGRRDERALFAFLATVPLALAVRTRALPANSMRLVTDPLGSRGKTERLVCRADGELRTMRLLDRESRASNERFVAAERGDLLAIEPLPPNDRIGPEVAVRGIREEPDLNPGALAGQIGRATQSPGPASDEVSSERRDMDAGSGDRTKQGS